MRKYFQDIDRISKNPNFAAVTRKKIASLLSTPGVICCRPILKDPDCVGNYLRLYQNNNSKIQAMWGTTKGSTKKSKLWGNTKVPISIISTDTNFGVY